MPTVGFNLCKNAGHLKNVNKVSTGCLVPEHELTTAAKRALRQMQWEAMKTGLMDWIKGIRVVHTLYKLAMADEILIVNVDEKWPWLVGLESNHQFLAFTRFKTQGAAQ